MSTCNVVFFFFSSRRRHTRLQGDWSSDVCSSDLCDPGVHAEIAQPARAARGVHLDDRFEGRRRIGRQADRRDARGAPILRWRSRHDGCTEAAAEKLGSAAHARVRSLAPIVRAVIGVKSALPGAYLWSLWLTLSRILDVIA